MVEQPFRERLRAQLMLALYRSGRQSEALEPYRQTAALFAEELGIEPGPELRGRERAIVSHDPGATATRTHAREAAGATDSDCWSPTGARGDLGAARKAGDAARNTDGAGWVRKTRLALEVAAKLKLEIELPAFFVELAPLADPDLVLTVIAQTLGVNDGGEVSRRETLSMLLRDRRLLLVLDNFEHLLDASADVARLLADVPGLTVLATSRSPLRVRAETRYEIGPPAAAEALALFVERARAAQADFDPTRDTEEICQSICQRLDGLPLTIEFAAARVNVVLPATILDRLRKRLPVPSAGLRRA